ncbi:retrotransposon protein, putative, ty1-copia subclass [Tanacetum coccineum]
MFQVKASKECLDVVKSLMACKPKPGASIYAFVLEMKGYFVILESLNMVFNAEISINIILPRIKKIDVPSTLAAHVLTVGHNAKKRKTYHSNCKRNSAKGKSDRGSKRKTESEIVPTSDPKESVCFYCNTKGHWQYSCPKYLKDLKDGKVKKGSHSGMFMIELYNTIILDSWVLDTRCGTHICIVLHGLKESRRLKHGQLNLVMGNRKITLVTRIGKYELMLKYGVRIDLNHCCYSSEMTRNIISFHALFKDDYKFSFDNENGDILVYSNGCFMFKASPCKGIYETVEFSQLTPPRTPELNRVAEKRNRTLLDTVVTPVEPDDISLPIRRTSGRVSKPPQFYYGFHIEEDKISDSTLSELDEPSS